MTNAHEISSCRKLFILINKNQTENILNYMSYAEILKQLLAIKMFDIYSVICRRMLQFALQDRIVDSPEADK